MKLLTEDEVKSLMQSDAYQNRDNPKFAETQRQVSQAWDNLYPEDDRNTNPQNYYIWKSVDDSKTRSSHAKREGEVFSWNNPPEGGHPGEDYNCRCWAKPYESSEEKICPIDSSFYETVSSKNNFIENIQNWNNEKKRVDKLKISDENKHQYMSCLSGRGNANMALLGLGVGAAKEVWDFSYKTLYSSQRKKNGGVIGVALDGGKDIVNNIKGLKHGFIDKKPCINLLKKKIP